MIPLQVMERVTCVSGCDNLHQRLLPSLGIHGESVLEGEESKGRVSGERAIARVLPVLSWSQPLEVGEAPFRIPQPLLLRVVGIEAARCRVEAQAVVKVSVGLSEGTGT